MIGASLSLALIGVGHLVGITVGIAMIVGLLISYGILLPWRSAGQLGTGDLADAVGDVFGHDVELGVLSGNALRRERTWIVRVARDGEALARRTGLLDAHGRPVRGLPPTVVSGSVADSAAVLRGAFLARGSLTEPGRAAAMEFTCPGPEAALALVGAARRLKVLEVKARQVRGVDRVVVRSGDAIKDLLQHMGAAATETEWENRREIKNHRAGANRLRNFDDANLRRSAQAAVAAGAKVERALDLLGDDAPEHLRAAGRLRVANKQASLDELGRLSDPPLTKDAIAGRIRRLLAMADRRAEELGVPSTGEFAAETGLSARR